MCNLSDFVEQIDINLNNSNYITFLELEIMNYMPDYCIFAWDLNSMTSDDLINEYTKTIAQLIHNNRKIKDIQSATYIKDNHKIAIMAIKTSNTSKQSIENYSKYIEEMKKEDLNSQWDE